MERRSAADQVVSCAATSSTVSSALLDSLVGSGSGVGVGIVGTCDAPGQVGTRTSTPMRTQGKQTYIQHIHTCMPPKNKKKHLPEDGVDFVDQHADIGDGEEQALRDEDRGVVPPPARALRHLFFGVGVGVVFGVVLWALGKGWWTLPCAFVSIK